MEDRLRAQVHRTEVGTRAMVAGDEAGGVWGGTGGRKREKRMFLPSESLEASDLWAPVHMLVVGAAMGGGEGDRGAEDPKEEEDPHHRLLYRRGYDLVRVWTIDKWVMMSVSIPRITRGACKLIGFVSE